MKKKTAVLIILFTAILFLCGTAPAGAASGKASVSTDSSSVLLVAVGDDLLHTPVYSHLKTKKGYNFDLLFKHMKPYIEAADLAAINQETILVPRDYSTYPCFGSPYAVADAIAKAGFDIVTHATNHTMDRGTSNILGTLKYWRKNHPEIHVLGIHRNQQEADTVQVIEKNGIKFALLNYTYGLNGFRVPSGQGYLVDLLTWSNSSRIRRQIRWARKHSDFVIVFPHWGSEYMYKPDSDQKAWANLFLEEGVDLVVGAHPHVLQPVTVMKRRDGHRMVCYYSLGNFISSQSRVPRMLGGMARVRFVKDAKGARIKAYTLEPLVTHITYSKHYFSTYPLRNYSEKLASQHYLHRSYPDTMTVRYLRSLYRQITGQNAPKSK